MNRRTVILILLPALALSLACSLSTARRWAVRGADTPTPAQEMTSTPVPTATEAEPPAPTPTVETPPATTSPPTPPSPCGDGVCDYYEWQNPRLCPQDCPPGAVYVGEVELDMEALQQLQAAVDQGHQPWRLDPLQVAWDEGEQLGFDPAQDVFDLLSSPNPAPSQAEVLVLHGEHFYVIHLVQPVRAGPDGIWAIVRVDRGL